MSTSSGNTAFKIGSLLDADGPHPGYAEQLRVFGQFVGVWDMAVSFFDKSGRTVFQGPGQWSFGWVLDGRAVQDVLTYADLTSADHAPGRRRIGTSLRHYSPVDDCWRMVWVGATSNIFGVLRGGLRGNEIHLEGGDFATERWHWIFKEIEADRFRWQGDLSLDGGKSWRTEQVMLARRRRG